MATKTVRYVFEEPINDVAEVQITVGTVNLAQLGEHAKLRRIYQLHSDTLAGTPIARIATQEQLDTVDADVLALNSVWGKWAGIKVSIRAIKVRLVGDDTDYLDVGLDILGWDGLEGAKSIPIDLFDALDIATLQVNPRVFGRFVEDSADPKARTVGVISVN